MLNEKKLIKGLMKNDEAAFDQLYDHFSAKLFGVCLRYGKNYQDAEDLLHEGFLRVLEKIKDFRFEGSFEGWMRKVMVSTAINHYRKSCSDHYDVELSQVPIENEMMEDTYSYLSTNEILNYVQDLPDGYRMVFNLYVIEGYKHHEIAEIIGISENTSKSQLMKARRCLMQKIKESEYEKVV